MAALSVYVTAADRTEAEAIGVAVVTEGLAACANVFGGVRSIFRWQGRIERAEEAALLLKTDDSRLETLISRVKVLHSYDLPCIVAYSIVGGNQNFLAWISMETRDQTSVDQD